MDRTSVRTKLIERDPTPYDRFLSSKSLRRRPAIMREMHNLTITMKQKPVNLCGGLPNPVTFTFEDASVTLKAGGEKVQIPPEAMADAQQYQTGKGYAPLMDKVKDLMREFHNPPNWDDKDIVMVTGGTEGIGLCVEMLLDEGDGIIVPEFFCSTTLSAVMPLGPTVLSVPCDESGLKTDDLSRMLDQYTGKKIKFLFVSPTGSNPTGTTYSLERRKEIYQLACKHDFLIIEDDQNSFLHLNVEGSSLAALPPSFLSLDTESRVLHVDSFSSLLGPGLRVGWVVGPTPLVQTILFGINCSSNHPSVLSQVVINETLKKWGKQGLVEQVKRIQNFYHTQRAAIVASAEKYLPWLAGESVHRALREQLSQQEKG